MIIYYLTKSKGYDMMMFSQAVSTNAGAVSLKKPHHVITLRFSEVVKDHAKSLKA